jgi:hypothetical protein
VSGPEDAGPAPRHVKDWDELLANLEHGQFGRTADATREVLRAQIAHRVTLDLTTAADALRGSLDAAARSSAGLQRVLVWLTAVLAVATAVGAFAAAWSAWG